MIILLGYSSYPKHYYSKGVPIPSRHKYLSGQFFYKNGFLTPPLQTPSSFLNCLLLSGYWLINDWLNALSYFLNCLLLLDKSLCPISLLAFYYVVNCFLLID